MEKKRSSCPFDACEKLFKAITVSSSHFRPIHHPRDSLSTINPPAPNPSANSIIPVLKTHNNNHTQNHPKPRVASDVVPIRFDYSAAKNNGNVAAIVTPRNKNMESMSQFVQAENIAAAKNQAEAGGDSQGKSYRATTRMESDKKMNANIEEAEFAEYIKRAGKKIRTTSSVDGGEGKIKASASASATGREDTGSGSNDNFSDYISRAKKRMLRTMSSFVGGRSDSMK